MRPTRHRPTRRLVATVLAAQLAACGGPAADQLGGQQQANKQLGLILPIDKSWLEKHHDLPFIDLKQLPPLFWERPVVPTQEAGGIEGSFVVSPDGDATYTVELAVPPGRLGIQPSLSLAYSSGVDGGALGVGWSLVGLPRISRCAPLLAVDGRQDGLRWDSSDPLCADGERLVLVKGEAGKHGAEYRKRENGYDTYVLEGESTDPASRIRLYYRDGRIATFGGGGQTAVAGLMRASGVAGTLSKERDVVVSWPITRLEDRAGNAMVVSWERRPGDALEQLPREIRYTDGVERTGTRLVRFEHGERADRRSRWLAGVELVSTRRLDAVRTLAPRFGSTAPMAVMSYELGYALSPTTGRELVTSLRQCDRFGACLPPSSFAYEPGSNDLVVEDSGVPVHPSWFETIIDAPISTADLNGDGRDELLLEHLEEDGVHRYVRLALPGDRHEDHFGPAMDSGLPVSIALNNGPLYPRFPFAAWQSFIDLDHQGGAEVLFVGGRDDWPQLYRWNGSRLVLHPDGADVSGCGPSFAGGTTVGRWAWLADLDGNGARDVISICQQCPAGAATCPAPDWGYRLQRGTTGSSYTDFPTRVGGAPPRSVVRPAAVDVDGDGRQELLVAAELDPTYTAWGADGGGTGFRTMPTNLAVDGDAVRNVWVDVNGDGLRDVVQLTTAAELSVRINTGRGFGPATPGLVPGSTSLGYADRNPNDVRVVDYNADGREDFLVFYERGRGRSGGDDLVIHLSDGARFSTLFAGDPGLPTASRTIVRSTLRRWGATQLLDVDGNGLIDLISAAGTSGNLMVQRHQGGLPDRLLEVRDGLGAGTGVEYTTLWPGAWAYPVSGPTCRYPLSCQTGQHVVGAQFDAGEPSRRRIRFVYEQARTDLGGRAFLGFGAIRQLQSDLGQTRILRFNNTSGSAGRFFYDRLAYQITTTTIIDPARRLQSVASYSRSALSYPDGRTRVPLTRASLVVDELGPGTTTTRISDRTVDYSSDDKGFVWREIESNSAGKRITRFITLEHRDSDRIYGLVKRIKLVMEAPGTSNITRQTDFSYDARGLLTRVVRDAGAGAALELRVDLTRGGDGQVETLIQRDLTGRERRIQLGYDVERVHPQVRTRGTLVDRVEIDPGLGLITATVDPAGVRRWLRWDGVGRGRGGALHPAAWSHVDYERGDGGKGLRIVSTDAGGRKSRLGYDARNHLVERAHVGFDGNWKIERLEVDDWGRTSFAWSATDESYPSTGGMRWVWDNAGRVREVHAADGAVTRVDWAGRVQTITDAAGHVSRNELGVGGEVTRACRRNDAGADVCLDYVWSAAGELRRATDGAGRVWAMTYDRRGRPTSVIGPDVTWTGFVHDAFGDLVERQWFGEGEATEIVLGPLGPEPGTGETPMVHVYFDHDDLGRVWRVRSDEDGETVYEWDSAANGRGKLAAATTADGTRVEYGYDTLGRRILERTRVFGETIDVGYEHDDAGRITRVIYPLVAARGDRLVVENHYTADGYLKAVTDAATGQPFWSLSSMSDDGQPTIEYAGNGAQTTSRYDWDSGRMTGVEVSLLRYVAVPGKPIGYFTRDQLVDLDYGYDATGRLDRQQEHVSGWEDVYEFDALDRLRFHTVDGVRQELRYDDFGNLIRYQGLGQCYGEGGAGPHALTSVVSGSAACGSATPVGSYGYDRRGRQIEAPGRSVEFTWFDLPKRIERPGHSPVELAYDPLQHRVGKRDASGDTITLAGWYERVRAGGQVTHAFTVQGLRGPVAQVVFDETAGVERTAYLHTDRQGSVVLVTDELAQPVARYRYSPFGARSVVPGSGAGGGGTVASGSYTGHRFDDDLGLIDMRGRVYDPAIGRFLSADPILTYPLDRQDWNPYSYALNNPVRFTDPTGFQECDGSCPPAVVDSDPTSEEAALAALDALLAATGPHPEGSVRAGADSEEEPTGPDWELLARLLGEDSNMIPTFLAGTLTGAGVGVLFDLGLFEEPRPVYRRTYEAGVIFGTFLGLLGDAAAIVEGFGIAGGSAGGGLAAAVPSGGTSILAGGAGVALGWSIVVAGVAGVGVHTTIGVEHARELYTMMSGAPAPGQFAASGTRPAAGDSGALARALGAPPTTGGPYQAHHIIPSQIVELFQDFFTEIGFITNGVHNGIWLPTSQHLGYHSGYNRVFVRLINEVIDMGLPASVAQTRIAQLTMRARLLLDARVPLYARAMGIPARTFENLWYRALRSSILY